MNVEEVITNFALEPFSVWLVLDPLVVAFLQQAPSYRTFAYTQMKGHSDALWWLLARTFNPFKEQ